MQCGPKLRRPDEWCCSEEGEPVFEASIDPGRRASNIKNGGRPGDEVDRVVVVVRMCPSILAWTRDRPNF